MMKMIKCPNCNKKLIQQIDSVNGILLVACPNCKKPVVLNFENGTVKIKLYEIGEEA